MARELTSFLTQLEKTQSFIHFGAEINQGIKSTLAMGEKLIYGFFSQESDYVIDSNLQILIFTLIWSQIIQAKTPEEVRAQCKKVADRYYTDDTYRKIVDGMISACENLNKLLGLVSAKHAELV